MEKCINIPYFYSVLHFFDCLMLLSQTIELMLFMLLVQYTLSCVDWTWKP